MIINIDNLRLRTIVGINDWEKKSKQDVIINIQIEFDGEIASKTDDIDDTVDYKTLNKKIIKFVEDGNFNLLERMASGIAELIFQNKKIQKAVVRIDKPGALRYADSVSVTEIKERN